MKLTGDLRIRISALDGEEIATTSIRAAGLGSKGEFHKSRVCGAGRGEHITSYTLNPLLGSPP